MLFVDIKEKNATSSAFSSETCFLCRADTSHWLCNLFPPFVRSVGDESQSNQTGLLEMSFQNGDAFGDEDKGFDLLGSDVND